MPEFNMRIDFGNVLTIILMLVSVTISFETLNGNQKILYAKLDSIIDTQNRIERRQDVQDSVIQMLREGEIRMEDRLGLAAGQTGRVK